MDVVNLAQKAALFNDHWHPRIVGELNGQQVKLAKIEGEFIWHAHDEEDEMFLVISGQMKMCLEDGDKILSEGEMIIVPKGVRHKPVAEKECTIMLFEPKSVVNTGTEGGARTVDAEWI